MRFRMGINVGADDVATPMRWRSINQMRRSLFNRLTNAMNQDETNSTHCRLLTAAGRSAVAVVLVDGPQAINALSKTFEPASGHRFSAGQIRYGQWRSSGESVVVSPLAGDAIEVHCHGGVAAAARVIEDLLSAGCIKADPGFAASAGERVDPLIAQAMATASRCRTTRTAAIAMDQVRGAFADWLCGGKRNPSPEQLLVWSDWTMRLDRPFEIALIGPPNVGKSSIINAIVGYDRSITMDMPGTTRDVLQAETVIDGLPMRFYDTAGIRESDEPIEREGVRRAGATADTADLIITVRDDQQSMPIHPRWKRIIQVCNKTDLGSQANHAEIATTATAAGVSSGIENLQKQIVQTLVPHPPPPGSPVILNTEQYELVAGDLAAEHNH